MAFATREKVIINPARGSRKSFGRKSKSSKRNRPACRKNTGEIVSFVLNPGSSRGRGKMAAKKQKKRKSYGSSSHRAKTNPGRRSYKTKTNGRRRRYARNPGGVSMSDLLMEGVFATAGAVGSKLLTQAVLGSNNTGFMGYAGNAVAGVAIGLAAGMTNATRKYAKDIYIGTAVAIIIRVISDYTSYGSALALSGVGDYQVQNFAVPQRLANGLYSSEIAMPAGWGSPAAPLVTSSNAVPASHGGASGGGMSGFYDTDGFYAVN